MLQFLRISKQLCHQFIDADVGSCCPGGEQGLELTGQGDRKFSIMSFHELAYSRV